MRRVIEHYWPWGAVMVEWYLPGLPRLFFTRNGKCLGVLFSMGNAMSGLHIDVVLYRHAYHPEDED